MKQGLMVPTLIVNTIWRTQLEVRREFQEVTNAHLLRRGNRHGSNEFSMKRDEKDRNTGNLIVKGKKHISLAILTKAQHTTTRQQKRHK